MEGGNLVRRLRPVLMGVGLSAALCVSGCGTHQSTSELATSSLAPRPEGPAPHLDWPVPGGVLSSPFGMRHGVMHDGVDIAAPAGTPVRAAAAGLVIFAGHMRGYGNVVILHHDHDYVTIYSHNRLNLVREGQRVRRDQKIAEVGRTGRTSGANLHFEVRHDNLARNPLDYLPVSTGARFAAGGAL